MTIQSGFEILSEYLFPQNVFKDKNNPYVVQGYWVQISVNSGFKDQTVNINFTETTNFTQGAGYAALMAQYIGADGEVNVYDTFFPSPPVAPPPVSSAPGFTGIVIPAGQTVIFGVQALPISTAQGTSQGDPTPPEPQGGTGWRGTVQITGQASLSLTVIATHRLVYFDSSTITTANVLSASVYPVPTFLLTSPV